MGRGALGHGCAITVALPRILPLIRNLSGGVGLQTTTHRTAFHLAGAYLTGGGCSWEVAW